MSRFKRFQQGEHGAGASTSHRELQNAREAAARCILVAPEESDTPRASGMVIVDADDRVRDISAGLLNWLSAQRDETGEEGRTEAVRCAVLAHNRLPPGERIPGSSGGNDTDVCHRAWEVERTLSRLWERCRMELKAAPPPLTSLQIALNQRDRERFGAPRLPEK